MPYVLPNPLLCDSELDLFSPASPITQENKSGERTNVVTEQTREGQCIMDVQILKERVSEFIDKHASEIVDLSLKIHSKPELAFQEVEAAANLAEFLKIHGLQVEMGTSGMQTAFKASVRGSSASPLLALLAEYDALPHVGHACGHNIIGASAAAAGAALAACGGDLPGSVWVLGTPAEEGGGGKVVMVKDGIFKDVDGVLMMHPTSGTSIMGGSSTAIHSFVIRYKGKPSHAAGSPHQGVNALDAATIFLTAVGLMRQHVKEEVRLHGIITRGGEASNIIPEETEIRYMARAKSRAVLDDAIEKVKRCIQAGAVGTGCSVEVEERKGYEATRHNSTLAAVLRDNYIRAGIEMAPEPRDGKGSTDLGDVSQVVPQACAYPAIAPSSVAGHSHEFAQAAASPDGHRVLLLSAKAIAWAAIDIMSDPAILDAAWKEFDSKE